LSTASKRQQTALIFRAIQRTVNDTDCASGRDAKIRIVERTQERNRQDHTREPPVLAVGGLTIRHLPGWVQLLELCAKGQLGASNTAPLRKPCIELHAYLYGEVYPAQGSDQKVQFWIAKSACILHLL
jgi:hypothetical protein